MTGTYDIRLLKEQLESANRKIEELSAYVASDVSESKVETIDEQKLFLAIANAQQDAIFCKDTDRRYTFANDAMAAMLGCSVDQIVGKLPEELFDSGAVAMINELDSLNLSGHSVDTIREMKIGDKRFVFHVIQVPLRSEKAMIIGVTGIVRDITRTYDLEEQLKQAQKMEAISILSGGISHDFNNLLSIIGAQCDLLEAEVNEPDAFNERLRQIRIAIDRASEVASQLSNLRNDKLNIRKTVEFSELLDEVCSLIKSSAPSSIRLELAESSSPLPVNINISEIHQVVINLCTNAIHAMAKSGVLKVSTRRIVAGTEENTGSRSLKAGEYLRLTISDTGCGMAPEIKEKIFDPYFTTKDPSQGTGLGLSVVYTIISKHEGLIEVDSEPGEGSAFHVYLPIASDENGYERVSRVVTESVSKGSGRVMFIDDEYVLVDIAGKVLGQMGFEVTGFTDPVKALEHFRENANDFDVVITDLMMPNIKGDVLTRHIKKYRSDIPVMLCSGNREAMDSFTLPHPDFTDLLIKPVSLIQVAAKVNDIVGAKMEMSPS